MGRLTSPDDGVRVRRFADLETTPWRNGRGLTREVASRPDPQRPGGFLWRVSVADVVDDGPFSTFSDVDRRTLLVDDATVDLTVDGRRTRLRQFVPLAFRGEAGTTVHLESGPARLLNVMTARGATDADVDVVRGAAVDVGDDAQTRLLVVLQGVGALVGPGTEEPSLAPLDAVLVPGRVGATLDVSAGVAAVIRFD